MNRYAFAACAALLATVPAFAAAPHEHAQAAAAPALASAHAIHAVGVVRAVDAAQARVTVAHEPIESLGWPGMTMAFRVGDPKLLGTLVPGKKIRFAFVQQGAAYVITAAE